MIPNYQPIDGKNLTVNKGVIEKVFDVTGGVLESSSVYLGQKTIKFAFFNTGELCEVLYTPGDTVLLVRAHDAPKRTFNWLRETLVNRMKETGWNTNITEGHEFLAARFYPIKK